MKKVLAVTMVLGVVAVLLTGCATQHTWEVGAAKARLEQLQKDYDAFRPCRFEEVRTLVELYAQGDMEGVAFTLRDFYQSNHSETNVDSMLESVKVWLDGYSVLIARVQLIPAEYRKVAGLPEEWDGKENPEGEMTAETEYLDVNCPGMRQGLDDDVRRYWEMKKLWEAVKDQDPKVLAEAYAGQQGE